MSEESVVDRLIELVELNIGNWKPLAVAIVDVNHKVWGEKGAVPKNVLSYYKKFPLSGMQVGDNMNNSGSFLMKIDEETGIIAVMSDVEKSRLAAINLRRRLNSMYDLYTQITHQREI